MEVLMRRVFVLFCLCLAAFQINVFALQSWEDVTLGIKDREFYAIQVSGDGDTGVYVGTGAGVYVNEGKEGWRRIFKSRGKSGGVNRIFTDDRGVTYVATKNGLYVSRDSGNTWARKFKGIGTESDVRYVAHGNMGKETIYIGTLKGLFWSEDGGNEWKKFAGELGGAAVESIAIGHGYVFAIAGNKVYRISGDKNYINVYAGDFRESHMDENADIGSVSREELIFSLNHIAYRNGRIYLATQRGLFLSRDNGSSWERFSAPGLSDRGINHILFDGTDGVMAVATEGGVFQYIKEEGEWKSLYEGMDATNVKMLAMDVRKNHIWALARNRVYRLENNPTNPVQLEMERIFSEFKNEPTADETRDMAIHYAEVHPEKIEKWRRGAKFRALFPKVNFGLDQSKSDTYEIYTASSKSYWVYGPEDESDGWDLNFTWDLADLVWNPSQTSIDVRSKLMVQLRDDIVDEVTRLYFERRRLQIERLINPPANLQANVKQELRIREITAGLDGLTGGTFSRAIDIDI